MSDIYVPKQNCMVELDGVPMFLNTSMTVRQGHPLLTKYPGLFEPLNVTFDNPVPTPPPPPPTAGSPRGVYRGARTRGTAGF